MNYYRKSAAVEELLKGAKFVRKLIDDNYACNGHAMAYSGNKSLYSSPSETFIVHTRVYHGYGSPAERVLLLPADLHPTVYLDYESKHQADYSSWYDMIEDNTAQP